MGTPATSRVSLFAGAALVGAHSTVRAVEGSGPPLVITVLMFLLFAMFAGALWVVYKLWMAVIDVVANKPSDRADRLAAIIGRSEVGVDAKSIRVKAVGAGLGGTIAILAIAVAAMYVLNSQVVT